MSRRSRVPAHHSAYRARLTVDPRCLSAISKISPSLGISHQAETWACDETLRSGRQMPDLEVPRLASSADCCSESSRCPQENWTCEFLWARRCGRHDSVGVASKNRPIRASHPIPAEKKEADMLNSMKSGAPEK